MQKIPSNINNIINEFVNAVNELLKDRVKKIILYGSYARGDYNFDIYLSPLLKNIDKYNYWLKALPFYMNVQKEGVVLSESKNI